MALTAEEQRRCYLYLGYIQVDRTGTFVGGVPQTTEVVQKLQVSLDRVTANGETTVRKLLVGDAGPPAIPGLDDLYAGVFSVDLTFLAAKVGSIELNPNEYSMRRRQYDDLRRQLAVTLDVALDPATEADRGGGGMFQGPWGEP